MKKTGQSFPAVLPLDIKGDVLLFYKDIQYDGAAHVSHTATPVGYAIGPRLRFPQHVAYDRLVEMTTRKFVS